MSTPAAIRGLINSGRYGEAIDACVNGLEAGGEPELYHLLAVACERSGRIEQSLPLFAEAARLMPDRPDVAFNRGVALVRSGKAGDAVAEWQRALSLDGRHEGALYNLARAATDAGDMEQAESLCRRLLERSPGHVAGLYNLGNLLLRDHRRREAMEAFRKVVELEPGHAGAWANLSLAALLIGDPQAALAAGRAAVQAGPDRAAGHINLAYALLKTRRLAEGFAEMEWRRQRQRVPFAAPPEKAWRSGPLRDSRLIVFAEQGQGDAIHFLRYVTAAAEPGNEVSLVVHPSLVRLAKGVEGAARALPFDAPLPPFDAFAPLMSLPHLTGLAGLGDIPAAPYLSLPPAAPPSGGVAMRVGLVWRGNPEYGNDAERSCPLSELRPLLKRCPCRWTSLQMGARQEIEQTGLSGVLDDPMDGVQDFFDTSGIIQSLDLVIGVDTAVIHLAGALGKPAFLMLPHVSDWRWFDDDATTPWYPSLRLFRQRVPGDWQEATTRIAEALAHRMPL